MSDPGLEEPLSVPRSHDLVTLILRDHRALADLLEAARGGEDDDEDGEGRAERFWRPAHELARHEASEDRTLYTVLRDHTTSGAAVAEAGLQSQQRLAGLLASVEHRGPDSPAFDDALAQLTAAVEEHAAWEEAEALPLVRELTDDERLEWGDRYTQAKKTAPTRPHPHVPPSPTVRTLTGPLVALLDRTRDLLLRRPMPNRSASLRRGPTGI